MDPLILLLVPVLHVVKETVPKLRKTKDIQKVLCSPEAIYVHIATHVVQKILYPTESINVHIANHVMQNMKLWVIVRIKL